MIPRKKLEEMAIQALKGGFGVESRDVELASGECYLRWFATDAAEVGRDDVRMNRINRDDHGHYDNLTALAAAYLEYRIEWLLEDMQWEYQREKDKEGSS